MRDGQKVVYTGFGDPNAVEGDEGRVLASSATGAHVKWANGQYSLVPIDDLAVPGGLSVEAILEDSLEFHGGIEVVAARDVYEDQGPEGLINHMASTGHLASFPQIAEDTLDAISARLRQDLVFMSVVETLDDADADTLVRMASLVLVRDAFGLAED